MDYSIYSRPYYTCSIGHYIRRSFFYAVWIIKGVLYCFKSNYNVRKVDEVGMSMEFVNRICPNCWNSYYVVLLGNFSKAYKYKCMNCNHYFNDIDVNEPSAPIRETQCMNSKVDMVEVVRCRDCKRRGTYNCPVYVGGDGLCSEPDDWFCADGERQEVKNELMQR